MRPPTARQAQHLAELLVDGKGDQALHLAKKIDGRSGAMKAAAAADASSARPAARESAQQVFGTPVGA